MCPLLILLLSLTLAIVHATFELRRQVTRVEHGTSSVVLSGHLVRICNRYETDYWDALLTASSEKKKQAAADLVQLLKILDRFRQQSDANADRSVTTRLEQLRSDYARF